MKNTKTSTKLLITLVIMLLAICLLGANKVNATDITDEEVQAIMSRIPDTIETDRDVKTSLEYTFLPDDLAQIIRSKAGELPENLELGVFNYQDKSTGINDLSKLTVLLRTKSGMAKEYSNKTVTIKYKDTNWNEIDKNYVADKISKGNFKDVIVYGEHTFESDLSDNLLKEIANSEYEKLLNDSSIKCEFVPRQGDGVIGWCNIKRKLRIF